MRIRVVYDLPPVVYAAGIFVLSSIPYLKPPDLGFNAQDKLFHIFEYGFLALLTLRSFTFHLGMGRNSKVISIAVCMIYAALDELHQALVPGRFCDIWDFVADAVGIVFIYYLYWQFHRIKG